jgi:hypothetical protein
MVTKNNLESISQRKKEFTVKNIAYILGKMKSKYWPMFLAE